MEISPERKQDIKTSLAGFMNEAEVEQFMDLGYAIELIKQEQACWQALVSIGVHAQHLYAHADSSGEEAVLRGLIAQALKPLQVLLESFVLEPGKQSLEDEPARMLFHTRFALGFVLLANGDTQRSMDILHEMAATKLSVRGTQVRSGPGIVRYKPDMAVGKRWSALSLLAEYFRQKDYDGMLYLITEAAACISSDTVLVSLAPVILDHWAAECEKADATQEYDFPFLDWLALFAGAAEILSVCQHSDSAGDVPSKCKPESAQFLAWKFGQIVGRYAVHDSRWSADPFKPTLGFFFDGAPWDEGLHFLRDRQEVDSALRAALTLLSEHDSKKSWGGAARPARPLHITVGKL